MMEAQAAPVVPLPEAAILKVFAGPLGVVDRRKTKRRMRLRGSMAVLLVAAGRTSAGPVAPRRSMPTAGTAAMGGLPQLRAVHQPLTQVQGRAVVVAEARLRALGRWAVSAGRAMCWWFGAYK
jgi:hypothetical protein